MQESGISCIKCGYDMRLLDKPQCPECGWVFDQEEYDTCRKQARWTHPIAVWFACVIASYLSVYSAIVDYVSAIGYYQSITGHGCFSNTYHNRLTEGNLSLLLFALLPTAYCQFRQGLWSVISRSVLVLSLSVWLICYWHISL